LDNRVNLLGETSGVLIRQYGRKDRNLGRITMLRFATAWEFDASALFGWPALPGGLGLALEDFFDRQSKSRTDNLKKTRSGLFR
jgi:hypothetical protein